jgi:DNA ligase 1
VYVDAVQHAYDLANDFAPVAESAKKQGLQGLEEVKMKIGIPIKVMLALKVEDISEGFEKCGKPAEFEFKYDGMRMQIHKNNNEIKIFTRRLENVTDQFPEVIGYVINHVHEKKVILDSESVGYSKKTGKYLPFQSISQRIKRKYDIEKMSEEMPVEVNVFDIMNHGGRSIVNMPFKERKKILKKIISNAPKKIVLAKSIITDSEKEVEGFYNEAISSGNEGLMIKKLDAPYKPGARVGFMAKLKPTKENLDLVIIRAEWGEGKRSRWLSSYTLACIDRGKFIEVGKVSTGLKEKREEGLSFAEMTDLLKPLIMKENGKEVTLSPKIVIEVGYEEIQKSPTYSSGYALRFPRVVRLRTMDKNSKDATTLKQVAEEYKKQKK